MFQFGALHDFVVVFVAQNPHVGCNYWPFPTLHLYCPKISIFKQIRSDYMYTWYQIPGVYSTVPEVTRSCPSIITICGPAIDGGRLSNHLSISDLLCRPLLHSYTVIETFRENCTFYEAFAVYPQDVQGEVASRCPGRGSVKRLPLVCLGTKGR
jgi:hypothetical protein